MAARGSPKKLPVRFTDPGFPLCVKPMPLLVKLEFRRVGLKNRRAQLVLFWGNVQGLVPSTLKSHGKGAEADAVEISRRASALSGGIAELDARGVAHYPVAEPVLAGSCP